MAKIDKLVQQKNTEGHYITYVKYLSMVRVANELHVTAEF